MMVLMANGDMRIEMFDEFGQIHHLWKCSWSRDDEFLVDVKAKTKKKWLRRDLGVSP
ncbi:hypothetical protein TSUD_23680 [Trifolium subterraneum]|uniref:Uncharacterized protein n=1 Tax=Trifolium subterraneum TaxID=3900 RepID=A0A2Z6LXH2_TRISU|nr:hypothetical protein TSUD_23680 [Trifolium subterraneum]